MRDAGYEMRDKGLGIQMPYFFRVVTYFYCDRHVVFRYLGLRASHRLIWAR
jgi:hypothetical protein